MDLDEFSCLWVVVMKKSYISHGFLGSVIRYSKINWRQTFFFFSPLILKKRWTKFFPDTTPLIFRAMEEILYWSNSRNVGVGWSLVKTLHLLPH